MYFLYSLMFGAALLLTAPWWLVRMLGSGKYRAGLGERLGQVPARLFQTKAVGTAPVIWVHAVSVGEVLAVAGLIAELRQRFPQYRTVVSTTTRTGQTLARQRFGESDAFYFPLDLPFAIRPYLQCLRPELVVIAETEFWPNFLRLAAAAGARIAIVNARISDRSFPRYRRLRLLFASVLRLPMAFLAQSEQDAGRLAEIGADRSRIRVSGNLKFDVRPPGETPLVARLRTALHRAEAGPVLVCGSTVEGEEPPVLQAFQVVREEFPRAMLLLAPRHPERFQSVADLVQATGLPWMRRSRWHAGEARTNEASKAAVEPVGGSVFLLDSIGELGSVYALADVAFVGGSLAPRGGHNILEPALFAVPVLVGPHMENFREIFALFSQAGALRVVRSGEELAATWRELLTNNEERLALGRRAASAVAGHRGATERTLAALEPLLNAAVNAKATPSTR